MRRENAKEEKARRHDNERKGIGLTFVWKKLKIRFYSHIKTYAVRRMIYEISCFAKLRIEEC
jgi:hypothetical protein